MKTRSNSARVVAAAVLLLAACDSAGSDTADAGSGSVVNDAGGLVQTRTDAATPSDAAVPPAADASAGDASAADASATDAGKSEDSGTPSGDAGTDLPGFRLVWSDEFDGAKGAVLDPSRWVYETGGTGFGNNQLEFDTDRAENASTNGQGELEIVARKESYMGHSYTSARLKTEAKFEHGYGRYEARIRIPFGQGMWPAFWMLGSNIASAGWPMCGEIDIMENIGREPGTVHGTVHGPGYSGGSGIGAPSVLPSGQRFADDYHVFAIEWEVGVIRWYVDGTLYQTRTPADLPSGKTWVYDHSFFILLNLAVGGQWPGNPDGTTTFPQTMHVDYVRVYERAP